jgi:predicted nucleic acid-binding protein
MFDDTNVLIYATVPTAPSREAARTALIAHATGTEALCISRQVLREFVAVITRPQVWAHAMSLTEAVAAAEVLAQNFDVLEDGPTVWHHFVELCRHFSFGGRQVHDANIVATMLAHGESRLLTFNAADFRRFDALVNVVTP